MWAKDADVVPWCLADVTIQVQISAVERKRAKGSRTRRFV